MEAGTNFGDPPAIETIEEYLNLAGWSPSFMMQQGKHGIYDWVQISSSHADPLSTIRSPSPFRLVLTKFDSSRPSHLLNAEHGRFGPSPLNWRAMDCQCIVSDELHQMPLLELHAEVSLIGITTDIEDGQINSALTDFCDYYGDALDVAGSKDFWEPLEAIDALFYYSEAFNSLVFVARGNMILEFLESDEFAQGPVREREQERKRREALWNRLGPEVGPDPCFAEGCTRERIELANLCFIHYLTLSVR